MLLLIKTRDLVNELNKLQKLKSNIEKELLYLPKGKLQCTKTHNNYQYRIDGKYISRRNTRLLQALIKRDYYERLLKTITPLIKNMNKVINAYSNNIIDNVYHNLNDGRKALLCETYYKTVEQIISDFRQQTFDSYEEQYPINSEIYTFNNEHVRSKSEKIIADELFRHNIPYIYEMPLVLQDGNRQIIVHPDFVALNVTTGEQIIIEHLGIMDNPEYAEQAVKKIRLYEKNGYIVGKNLIILFETKNVPLSMKSLKSYIHEFLL